MEPASVVAIARGAPSGGRGLVDLVRQVVAGVVVGQEAVVDRILVALLTGGHLLLQGVPGLAKTL